jgi:hypothetical protein
MTAVSATSSLKTDLEDFADRYFTMSPSDSCLVTTLKVASYATLICPLLVLALKAALYCTGSRRLSRGVVQQPRVDIQAVLNRTPPFAGYRIGQGTPYPNTNLTKVSIRPANLFFDTLLGSDRTTMPGSSERFAFRMPHARIRENLFATPPATVVSFSANGVAGHIGSAPVRDLGDLYGRATCRVSVRELQQIVDSQKIYVSYPLPLRFYQALKEATLRDNMVVWPGNARVRDLPGRYCRALVAGASNQFADYGFASRVDCERLLDMTVYELGALVVKSEDYILFLDTNGKIRERRPGEQDAFRLINACGIRPGHSASAPAIPHRTILTQTFKTALAAAEKDFVVFPAVGMGVWGGDPDLYWRAFLDAVVASGGPFEQIFVNPGHQRTRSGRYAGGTGNEFQTILDEYRAHYPNNTNLSKIANLLDRKTDLLQLAHQLKIAYPNKIVSLFNASDPDVTSGNHVGEYVNNLDHPPTTEENFTAQGTNGLCFEGITGVHEDPRRLIQVG